MIKKIQIKNIIIFLPKESIVDKKIINGRNKIPLIFVWFKRAQIITDVIITIDLLFLLEKNQIKFNNRRLKRNKQIGSVQATKPYLVKRDENPYNKVIKIDTKKLSKVEINIK